VNNIVLSGAPAVVPSGATLSCYQARQASVSHCRGYQFETLNSPNKEHLEGSNRLMPVNEATLERFRRPPDDIR